MGFTSGFAAFASMLNAASISSARTKINAARPNERFAYDFAAGYIFNAAQHPVKFTDIQRIYLWVNIGGSVTFTLRFQTSAGEAWDFYLTEYFDSSPGNLALKQNLSQMLAELPHIPANHYEKVSGSKLSRQLHFLIGTQEALQFLYAPRSYFTDLYRQM